MAIVDVPGLYLPAPYHTAYTNPYNGSLAMNGAGTKGAYVLRAPKTGSIRKLYLQIQAVTTATNTDVRIETVSTTTGDPTGTLFGTNTNVTLASGSITAFSIPSVTLTADASVTRGDLFAVVLVPTGTPNYDIGTTAWSDDLASQSYPDAYNGATWTKNTAAAPLIAIEYSDGSYAFMPWTFPGYSTSIDLTTATTPDEIALKFTVGVGMRVCGWHGVFDFDGDADIILYDSANTVLLSYSVDKDVHTNTAPRGPHQTLFNNRFVVRPNQTYRLALKPTSATTVRAYYYEVQTANALDQMAGGQDFNYSSRSDAGAWTDNTLRQPIFGLIFDGIERRPSAASLKGVG